MTLPDTGSQVLRCGEMIWVGGQADRDDSGSIRTPGDVPEQMKGTIGRIERELTLNGAALEDLVFLLCFYAEDGSGDEHTVCAQLADCLPDGVKTAVNLVPVPRLMDAQQLVEIEGYAMRHPNGDLMPRSYAVSEPIQVASEKFCPAIRCGKMIFVSGQAPIQTDGTVHAPGDIVEQTLFEMVQIERILAQFGAGFADVVKSNRWYSGRACVEDFEPAALACARFYPEPGPAATGIPVPRFSDPDVTIKLSCVAMLGEDGRYLPRQHVWPEGHWDWTIKLPYKHGIKCDNMIFIGGQVALDTSGKAIEVGDLPAQVERSLGHIQNVLDGFDKPAAQLCKLTTLCRHEASSDIASPVQDIGLVLNAAPVNTQIPLPALAYPGLEVEIEAFAMLDRGKPS